MLRRFMRSFWLPALVLAASLALSSSLSLAGLQAGRFGDLTTHGGTVQAGSANVLINGVQAARLGDFTSCPLITPIPHVGGPISTGSGTVFINGLPAARVGSQVLENGGLVSQLSVGSGTVFIGD